MSHQNLQHRVSLLESTATAQDILSIDTLKGLIVEASSACNAACPYCSRRQKIRHYGNHFLTTADFKKLPRSLFTGLKWITFGGNFGDFACNPEMPDIVQYIRDLNPNVRMGAETNGSPQSADWWSRLGSIWGKGVIIFALDGLEDTHALHRIGTDFHRTLEHMRSFSEAGGEAHWKFIVFKHNEHQIEAAEKLAEQAGCRRFLAVSSREYDEQLQRPEHIPTQVKRERFRHHHADGDTPTLCKPLSNKSIYLAADGTVHPCCHAHCVHVTEHNADFLEITSLIDAHKEAINIKTTPLEEILRGQYFRDAIRLSKSNSFCRTKCGPERKKVLKELVVVDTTFR